MYDIYKAKQIEYRTKSYTYSYSHIPTYIDINS